MEKTRIHTQVRLGPNSRHTWSCAALALCCACTTSAMKANSVGGDPLGTSSAGVAGSADARSTSSERREPLVDGAVSSLTSGTGSPNLPSKSSPVQDASLDEDASPIASRDAGAVLAAPDPDAIRTALAAAICDALLACVGPAALPVLTAREDCKAYYTTALTEDDLSALDRAIASGTIALHPEQLQTCYHDTRALECQVQTERIPASCDLAIQGKRHIGEACRLNAECGSGNFCPVGESCPRVCQAAKASGQTCARDDECRRGLICVKGSCGAPAADNAACGGATGAACVLGDSCAGGTDTVPGSCSRDATIQVGDVNTSCNPNTGPWCRDGLSCAYDGAAGFKCVAAVAKGAMCRLALPSQCPNDSYCNASDAISLGTCTALPSEGQACAPGDQCAPGQLCVVKDASSAGTCRRWLKLGDVCSDSSLCRSGACVQHRCVIRPECN
jgi:hypothetical protein